MSGICGFTGEVESRKITIKRMTDVLTHRGPKGSVYFGGSSVTMGVCLLDPEATTEAVYNEDHTMTVAFDGRIYNSRELREELESEGHVFGTKDDAEVVLHGFEQWGEEVLTKLRGMFAFAIYNEKESTLLLARDPFGIKPLFYTIINNELIFASEIKSIMRYPDFDRRLNINALDSYLSFGYAVPPETFFEGVFALLPGNILWCKNGEVAVDRYFDPRFTPDERLTEDDAVNKVTEVIRDSVNAHKVCGGAVGCFLSGGVDSGYISTYFSGDKTFSIGFEGDGGFGEVSAAKIISEEVGADHYTEIISDLEFWKTVPKVQRIMDQPMANPSTMAVYFSSRLASKYVTAALSGEGADELFGGYEAYRAPDRFKMYHKVPYGVRKLLSKIALKMPDSKAKDFIVRGTHPMEEDFVGSSALLCNEEKAELLKDTEIPTKAQDTTKRFFRRVRKSDELSRMQYLDINMYLAGSVLSRADRMSMANSLELRLPYLDREVYRVAASLPSHLRATKDNTKIALRSAASRYLTTASLPSSDYYVPLKEWLKEEVYYELIKDTFRTPTAQKYFNIDVLLNWLDDHYYEDVDNSRKIWAVYAFLVWYRQYFEEITTEEITEEAIAEVETFEEESTAANSTIGSVSSERLDELFGLVFDEEDGAGVEEAVADEIDSVSENTAEQT